MASTLTRRPLPALVSLLALLLLTGLVWWRVLHRGDGSDHKAGSCPTPTKTEQVTLPAPASITVQVLNSTTRSGIAAKVRSTLINDGFQSPELATNDKPAKKNKIKTTGEIRFGPKGKQGATLLRYYFPGATLVTTTSTKSTVVVSLGTTYRHVASAVTVKAALAGDKVAVASSSPPVPTPSGSASC